MPNPFCHFDNTSQTARVIRDTTESTQRSEIQKARTIRQTKGTSRHFWNKTMKRIMSPELIETINRELQNIPIGPARWKELSVELSQLRAAADATKPVHDFDRDPAGFMELLRANR